MYRTRDNAKAHHVARNLSAVTGRVFGVTKYDARTWEVLPQKRDFSPQQIKHFARMAEDIVKVAQQLREKHKR